MNAAGNAARVAKGERSTSIHSIHPEPIHPGVAIVGLGNWGSSLAHALQAAGIPLREAIHAGNSSRKHRPRSPLPRDLRPVTLRNACLDASILWLCVPDSAIAGVAQRLAERASELAPGPAPLRGRIVVHSSGALSAAVLAAAARAGASTASVHPLMTFPTRDPVPLSGVFFAVEADAAAQRKLYGLLRKLKGQPFTITSSGKAFYHAMGMLSSPLLVSLMAAAEECAARSGLSAREARRLIEPIATTTLRNVFSRGLPKSFSGPIARGDAEAIHLHLQAMAEHPILANLYRSLALYSLDVLPARNGNAIRAALRELHPKTAKPSRGRSAASTRSGRMRN